MLAIAFLFASARGQEAENASGGESKPDPEREEELDSAPLRILLLQGGANHAYEKRREILQQGIGERLGCEIEWTVVADLTGRSDVKITALEDAGWKWDFDLIVHDHCFPRVHDAEYVKSLLVPHENGIPAVLLHASLTSFPTREGAEHSWEAFTGASLEEGVVFDSVTLNPVSDRFALLKGEAAPVLARDELYPVASLLPGVTPVWTAKGSISRFEDPVAWTHRFGPGETRVFATSLGNQEARLADPVVLDFIARSVIWALDAEEEKLFKRIDPGESLPGVELVERPLDFLRPGASAARQGRGWALSERADADHRADAAIDGDLATFWESARPGPDSWGIEFPEPVPLAGLAIAWKEDVPREFRLEISTDGLAWTAIPDSDVFDEFERKRLTFRRISPEVVASRVRVTFLSTAPGEHPGIREVGVYTSPEEIPSAFRVGYEKGDGLNTAAPQSESEPLRLAESWQWRELGELPFEGAPQDWFDTAAGTLFLIAPPDGNRQTTIWQGHERKGEFAWTAFLEELDGSIAAFWDGEWLTVAEKGTLTPYRDSDGDGIADEKKSGGKVSDLGGRIRQMRLGIDGRVLALVSPEDSDGSVGSRQRSHQLVRFQRDGSDPVRLFASERPIGHFWEISPGKIYLQFSGETERRPFRCLPLHEPVLQDDFREAWITRASSEKGKYFSEVPFYEAAGEQVFSLVPPRGEEARAIESLVAEIPGLLGILDSGSHPLVLHRRGGTTRISRLWRGSEETPLVIDLDEVADGELVALLDSSSPAIRRETVFELFRRKRDLTSPVVQAGGEFSEQGREARLAYFSQLPPERSRGYLIAAAKGEPRHLAFHLLGLHPIAQNLEVYREILEIEEPEITAQILAALVETGSEWEELDSLVFDWTAHDSQVLAGTAVSYLLRRGRGERIWEAIGAEEDPTHALGLLPYLEASSVATRLLAMIEESSDPEFQRLGMKSLAALYRGMEEAAGTSRTEIESLFLRSLETERFDPAFLLNEMVASEMPLGSLAFLVSFAQAHLSYEPFVLGELEEADGIPAFTVSWLEEILADESRDGMLRLRAHGLLLRAGRYSGEEAWAPIPSILSAVANREMRGELLGLWLDQITASEGWQTVAGLAVDATDPVGQELAWEALEKRLNRVDTPVDIQDQVLSIFDRVLEGDSGTVRRLAALLVERAGMRPPPEVKDVVEPEGGGADPNGAGNEAQAEPEASAALEKEAEMGDRWRTAVRSHLAGFGSRRSPSPRPVFPLEGRDFETATRLIEAVTSSPRLGWDVFQSKGCVACHNVHGEGKVVGPDIVASVREKSLEEFAGLFLGGEGKDAGPFRANEFELKGGLTAAGWILDRDEGVVRLIDLAGNPWSLSEEDIHIDRGRVGPVMGSKGNFEWSAEDLASLRAYLIGLSP